MAITTFDNNSTQTKVQADYRGDVLYLELDLTETPEAILVRPSQ